MATTNQRRIEATARRTLVLLALFAAVGAGSAAPALAAEGPPPCSEGTAIDQYTECIPTSSGGTRPGGQTPSSGETAASGGAASGGEGAGGATASGAAGTTAAAITPAAEAQITRFGGEDTRALRTIVTSPAYGAATRQASGSPDAHGALSDARDAGGAQSAAASAVGAVDGNLLLVAAALLLISLVTVAVAVKRRRASSA